MRRRRTRFEKASEAETLDPVGDRVQRVGDDETGDERQEDFLEREDRED